MNWFFNRVTLGRLYVALALMSLLTVVLWAFGSDTDWIDTWAPNIAAELIGALITVVLIDLILAYRRRPLADRAAQAVRAAVQDLLRASASDRYARNQHVERASGIEQFVKDWSSELDTELPSWYRLKTWADHLVTTRSSFESIRDRYDRVLDEPLIAALDEFEAWAMIASAQIEEITEMDSKLNPSAELRQDLFASDYRPLLDQASQRVIAIEKLYRRQFGGGIELHDMWDRVVAIHEYSEYITSKYTPGANPASDDAASEANGR